MMRSYAVMLLKVLRKPMVWWGLAVLVGTVLPFFATGYMLRAFSIFYIYLMLGAGLSLVVNYAGLLALGHVAFFGVGAYVYALLNTKYGVPFFPALPVGMVIAGLFGVILAFPALRVRGDYLALVTLGFGEIVRVCMLNIWGPHGITRVAPPLDVSTLGSIENLYLLFYFITLLPAVLVLALIYRIDRSIAAQRWFAIRDNEDAARACGINSVRWLLLSFVLATSIAGIAGVIFAGIQRYVSPGSFVLDESIFILSIAVIAGGRSLWRLLIATAVLSFLPELLRSLADYRLLIFGAILALFIVLEEQVKSVIASRRKSSIPESVRDALPEESRSAPDFLKKRDNGKEWIINISSLTMKFGGVTAIDDVSLSVNIGGRIVALIGPNGAGKTTLFNCISGFYKPTSGQIAFPGARSPFMPYECARVGVARTFQNLHLFKSMTVRENIRVGCKRTRRTTFSPGEKVTEILNYLGLQDVADTQVASLPLRLQRLTELGRALALEPRVVLLDEIASGLSAAEKVTMAALLSRLSLETGIGFLIVEHDMDFVLPLSDDVIVLDTGKVIAQGSPDEITSNQKVIDAYLGNENAVA
jgi:ABC-type branched-subunit amino acid transport system ATPase component/ABC-type branched-subunit amino acid transport system permease subunit